MYRYGASLRRKSRTAGASQRRCSSRVAGTGASENDPRSPKESGATSSFENAALTPSSIPNALGSTDEDGRGDIGATYPEDDRRPSSDEGAASAPLESVAPSSALTRAPAEGNRAAGSFSSRVIYDPRELGRHIGPALIDRNRPLGEMFDEHRGCTGRRERRLTRQHLVGDDTERVEIAASVDFTIAGMACSGDMYVGVPIAIPVAVNRESPSLTARAIPKSVTIGRPRSLVTDEDIVRLDVAVNHAVLVGIGQGVANVAKNPPRLGHSHCPTVMQPLGEIVAGDVRHDKEDQL